MARDLRNLSSFEELQKHPSLIKVNRQLAVLELLVKKTADPESQLKCLVVSGPPGVGKSFTAHRALRNVESAIQQHTVKGYITPYQFYEFIAHHPGERDVLLADDCDGIFNNIESLNILKGSVDPETNYTVHWRSRAASIPKVTFWGKMIILTNYEFGNSPHYRAFLDRVHFFPLELTPEEVMYKVTEIAYLTAQSGVVEFEMVQDIVLWMYAKSENMRSNATFRTFNQALALALEFGSEWREVAKYTLLA